MKTLTTLLLFFIIFNANAQSLFHEDFENPDSVISSGSIGFAQCTRIAAGGNACDSSSYGIGDSCFLTTVPFSTIGQNTVILSFDHIAKTEYFDAATVEVSNDSGLTWTKLTGMEYYGYSAFAAQGNKFSEAAHPIWQPTLNSTPNNSWWRLETFDISSLTNNAQFVLVRFKLKDLNFNGMSGKAGWYLDNIGVDAKFLSTNFWYYNPSLIVCGVPQFATLYPNLLSLGYAPTDSFLINLNFGDGSDTSYYIVNGFPLDSINHFYVNIGAYNVTLTATDINGLISTSNYGILVNNVAVCSTIKGKVYVDVNSNCVFDSGDYPIIYTQLLLDSLGITYQNCYTDSTGDYTFNVPNTGSYNVILKKQLLNLSNICPASDTLNVSTIPSANNNFALACLPGYDVNSDGFVIGWSPISNSVIVGTPTNLYCQKAIGDFKIVKDSRVNLFFASPPGFSVSADTVSWSNAEFGSSAISSFKVFTNNGPLVNIGDTLCATFIADNLPGDLNLSNNIVTRCKLVKSSYDPNYKEVSPAYEIDSNQTLDYTIHFQNTGNDTAFKVILTDTIDSNLDLSTLTIKGGSHNFSTNVYGNRLLAFTFDPISLPDSGANQLASNGFVSYSIKVKSGTPIGTHISNKAYIFFDSNQPIITNATDNVIVAPTAINELSIQDEISVYPNPTFENVTVKSNQPVTNIKVLNLMGELVYSTTGNMKMEAIIPLHNFAKGVYSIIIESKSKTVAKKVIKM